MNILILGNAKDPHAAYLKNALIQAGATQVEMTWQPDSQVGSLMYREGVN